MESVVRGSVLTLSASMIVMVWPSIVNVKLGSRILLSEVRDRRGEILITQYRDEPHPSKKFQSRNERLRNFPPVTLSSSNADDGELRHK
jgi:hypothetical protein